ncbi:Sulfotransferase 1C2A [Nymphon striatum]|nr:Sulfotransferase 1C2A [Nymphon striatum]
MWGDYFKHVMSWYAHRNDENVLFLVYEQMIENPGEQIIKIGQFLGGDCEKLVSDSETVDVIKKLSSFDSMKEGDSINFEKTHITKENFSFFRKGKIGDYKNVLTDRQQELLSEKYKMWFKGTFLIDIWRPYVPQ